jgi:hypothetical protein
MHALGNSKVISASASIIATPARILGVSIKAGTDTASVKLLDGGSSGTQKTATLSVASGTSQHWEFPNGIQCATDIYATITGTTPEVAVEYEG